MAKKMMTEGFFKFTLTDTEDGVSVRSYIGNQKSIIIPDTLGGYPVVRIGKNCFQEREIERIAFPSGLKSIGTCSFCGVSGLKEVYIPASVEEIAKNAFSDCPSIEKFTVDPGNPNFTSLSDGVLYNKTVSVVIYYPSGSAAGSYAMPQSVTEIKAGAFYASENLVSVLFSPRLKKIGANAFEECIGLKKIMLPEGVETLGDYCFASCTSLSKVELPSTLNEVGQNCFEYCTGLVRLEIAEGLDYLPGGSFYGCENLREVVLPDSITELGANAFYDCGALEEVIIPAYIERIGANCFSWCEKLKEVFIPSSVRYIGENAFCTLNDSVAVKLEEGASTDGFSDNWANGAKVL